MSKEKTTVRAIFNQIPKLMYLSMQECIEAGNHLAVKDQEGYCGLCSYSETEDENMKERVSNWMFQALDMDADTYKDSANEWNCTVLAENAAVSFECEEWLEDETHWVWDLAVNVTEKYQK